MAKVVSQSPMIPSITLNVNAHMTPSAVLPSDRELLLNVSLWWILMFFVSSPFPFPELCIHQTRAAASFGRKT